MRTHPNVLVVLALLTAACADGNGPSGNEPPADGTLLVTTTTGGDDPDQDGYRLAVDGDSLSLAPTGTRAIGLSPGRHALRLLGVAEQCSVASDTVLEVDVPSRDTVPLAFEVSCEDTGVRITVTTTGLDTDAGYWILVDGAGQSATHANDTVVVRLQPGRRTIALTDLDPNCMAADPSTRTVTVVDAQVVPLDFTVVCTAASGVVGILITVSGPVLYEAFQASVDGSPWSYGVGQDLLLPGGPHYRTGVDAGEHVISLLGASHCSVITGSQTARVTVGRLVRDTVEVDFSVTCALPTGSVGTVRISTDGPMPASAPYTVWFEGFGYWDYGGAGEVLLGALDSAGILVADMPASGSSADPYWYDFELRGVPADCTVKTAYANPNPGFMITRGDTLDLRFGVTCPP